jgi:phage-related protein
MAFFGRSFIYDGVPSETYGLYISNIDASAINESMASSSMEVKEQKIFRRPAPYFLGATPSPKLQFEFSAMSEDEIDADTFQLISRWLFSSRDYKKLQIDQEDIRNIYFNCMLVDPKIIRVGNLIRGFSATVQCDSPFAWMYPRTNVYTYTDPNVNNSPINFYNASDDAGSYLYPDSLIITMNNFGGDCTIVNMDDNNRLFYLANLSPNEVITMNCNLQTISSSTGLKRLGNFNKNYLRLVPGINHLLVSGNISSLSMTTKFIAKKIAG